MSSDRDPPVRRGITAVAVVLVVGGRLVGLAAEGVVASAGNWVAVGTLVVFGTYALLRTYERNVVAVEGESQVDTAAESGDEPVDVDDATPDYRPVRILGLRRGAFKLMPGWTLLAIAPLLYPTDPVPWFVFPVAGALGLYLTHRLYEGPLAVS